MPALLTALDRPVPIVLAPTGMVPTRAMTPHVPLTPDEIARDVAAAAEIGITSVHLHARDAEGVPTWDREVYARIVGAVRERAPDVVINVSTSGRTWSELEKRADVLALDGDLKPDLASLTLSSLNFIGGASVNAPDVIRGLATIMRDRGIVPELEIFDLGMLNFAHVLRKEGLLPGPVVANLFFGNVAGHAGHAPRGRAGRRATPGRSRLVRGRARRLPAHRAVAGRRGGRRGPGRARGRHLVRPGAHAAGHQPDARRAGARAARRPRPGADEAGRAARPARRSRA